jgi:hypothetical protein
MLDADRLRHRVAADQLACREAGVSWRIPWRRSSRYAASTSSRPSRCTTDEEATEYLLSWLGLPPSSSRWAVQPSSELPRLGDLSAAAKLKRVYCDL